jgi:hypothetical protein
LSDQMHTRLDVVSFGIDSDPISNLHVRPSKPLGYALRLERLGGQGTRRLVR